MKTLSIKFLLALVIAVSNILAIRSCRQTPTTVAHSQDGLFPTLPGQLFSSPAIAFNQSLDGISADPASETIMKYVFAGDYTDIDHRIVVVELNVPYNVVGNAPTPITVTGVANNPADAGNYGVPADTVRFPELTGMAMEVVDPHMMIIDTVTHKLYELYGPEKVDGTHWLHHGAAVFDLTQDSVRKMAYDGYTSADAAGLPVLPGIVRYDELKSGVIKHALRMTFAATQIYQAQIYPAMHHSNGKPYVAGAPLQYLPMGARLRLKSTINPDNFTGADKTIVTCLQHYGVIVADIGTVFAITGTSDSTHVKQLVSGGYDGTPTSSSIRLMDKNGNNLHWDDFEVMPIGNKISSQMRQFP